MQLDWSGQRTRAYLLVCRLLGRRRCVLLLPRAIPFHRHLFGRQLRCYGCVGAHLTLMRDLRTLVRVPDSTLPTIALQVQCCQQ